MDVEMSVYVCCSVCFLHLQRGRREREREREREVEGESVWLIIDKLDITGKVKFNYNYLRQLLQREK